MYPGKDAKTQNVLLWIVLAMYYWYTAIFPLYHSVVQIFNSGHWPNPWRKTLPLVFWESFTPWASPTVSQGITNLEVGTTTWFMQSLEKPTPEVWYENHWIFQWHPPGNKALSGDIEGTNDDYPPGNGYISHLKKKFGKSSTQNGLFKGIC